MPRVSASTEIDAPPAVVWELLSDPHRYPELIDATDRMVSVPEAPMNEGCIYREYSGLGPFRGESEWTVTEFRPTRRQVHDGDDGTIRFHLEIDIEPTRTGCRLTHRLDMAPCGVARIGVGLLWPLFMRRVAQRSLDRTVMNVKTAATAHTPFPSFADDDARPGR
jgi:carbon monoxide dehydrogenase subunit G